MRWLDGYIVADWGTTNRRAYAVGADGTVGAALEDDLGVLSVPKGGFSSAVADIRAELGHKPLLLAGMVGSNRGWVEAPYAPCPAGLDDLVRAIRWVEPDIGIVPGVSWSDDHSADVMRGEEVQIFGAAAKLPPDCLVCHPGTHAKWIALERGRITRFRTRMTGEMFALLREHSILSAQLAEKVRDGAAFRSGVRRAFASTDLLGELFGVRARFLLGKASAGDCASWASGLLLGSDVRAGLENAGDKPIALVGRPDLTALYAAALAEKGREAEEIDGAEAFLAGIHAIVERLP